MTVTKDTPCTLAVSISINDGEHLSTVNCKLPQFRAEYAGIAFQLVREAIGEAGMKIAVFDINVIEQVGDVVKVDLQ